MLQALVSLALAWTILISQIRFSKVAICDVPRHAHKHGGIHSSVWAKKGLSTNPQATVSQPVMGAFKAYGVNTHTSISCNWVLGPSQLVTARAQGMLLLRLPPHWALLPACLSLLLLGRHLPCDCTPAGWCVLSAGGPRGSRAAACSLGPAQPGCQWRLPQRPVGSKQTRHAVALQKPSEPGPVTGPLPSRPTRDTVPKCGRAVCATNSYCLLQAAALRRFQT